MREDDFLIYTLTCNPSLDYLLEVEDFELGETNRAQHADIVIGGKGINVSLVLNNLGMDSTVLGFYGGFTGNHLQSELQTYQHIDEKLIQADGVTRINVKLKADKETEINGSGVHVNDDAKAALMELLAPMNEKDLIVISGSLVSGIDEAYLIELIQMLADKNVQLIFDMSSTFLLELLSFKPLLIKPNIAELASFYGEKTLSTDDVISYGKKLAKEATNVIVSMGGDGSLLFVGDDVYQATPPKGTLMNSVGAGDSMVAGFAYASEKGLGSETAFKYAASCGTATAYSQGLTERDMFNTIFDQTEIKKYK